MLQAGSSSLTPRRTTARCVSATRALALPHPGSFREPALSRWARALNTCRGGEFEIAQVVGKDPVHAWVGGVVQRFHVAAPGDADDLHRLVDAGLPAAIFQIAEPGGDVRR